MLVERPVSSRRRVLTAAALCVQLGLLVVALNLPLFQVRGAALTGAHLLDRAAVLRAAAVSRQSIFTLDVHAIRDRLLATPWVEDATVTTELPATVRVTITERRPALRLARDGDMWLVAGSGDRLAEPRTLWARWGQVPVLLDERLGTAQPIPPALITMLSAAAQRYPALLGCSVAAFEWDAGGVLSVWASTGWRAELGHVDTDSAVAAVPDQLAALGALRSALHFASPSIGYVDLENPSTPIVGGKPGLPRGVTAAVLPQTSQNETSPAVVDSGAPAQSP